MCWEGSLMNRYYQADGQKSITHPLSRMVPVSACPRVWSISPLLRPRGSSAYGDIFAMQMWCFCLSTRQNTTGLVRGLWPPERSSSDFQPLLLLRSGRDAYAKYYSGDGGDFVRDVSQERAAPAAASTTASKSLDGTVSPAMLTSPWKWLSLPPAAPAGYCCPFPAGQ